MPRPVEVLLSAVALLVLSPLLLVLALAVALSSPGPILYRQRRVGRGGTAFTLHKFRTMRVRADAAGRLTVGRDDPRTTAVGRFLRRTKLDELPQLFDVLRGAMSLVGPRPEVPEYVDLSRPDQRETLRHRPGLTDPASLAFRDESALLAGRADPEAYYVATLLPAKLALSAAYGRRRTWRSDLGILVATAAAIAGRPTKAVRAADLAGADLLAAAPAAGGAR
ncbi:sugar transferase [Nitriliruptoraceae bacterium ZYF776]|nr:sugar transferase [Profundirhabdus halotolerans]